MIRKIEIKIGDVILEGDFAYPIDDEWGCPGLVTLAMEQLIIKVKNKKIYVKSDSNHHDIEVSIPIDCLEEDVKKIIED